MRTDADAGFYPALERPIAGEEVEPTTGRALALVVETHPALADLMDFCSADPVQIALAVGMVSPHDEEDLDDLREIDLGEPEWFEPAVGLAAVRQGLQAVRRAPASVRAVLYHPRLRPEDVITDLEAIERTLLLAQQHETRFRFVKNDH